MSKSKVLHHKIPSEQREMSELPTTSTPAASDLEEENFDSAFWEQVEEKVKTGVSWNRAMDIIRAERFIAKHGSTCDALLYIIYKWPRTEKYTMYPELIPGLEHLIGRLTEIIVEKEKIEKEEELKNDGKTTKKTAERFRYKEDSRKPTLLHLAAEQDFLHVSKCLVDHYPGLITLRTSEGKNSAYPVELALREYNDETAAYLISEMKYDIVQRLFLYDESKRSDEQPSVKLYFGKFISYRCPETGEYRMEKTVLAVLNKLVNPRWPYLSDSQDDDKHNDDIQRALESLPDDPMNYHFFYHVLEADENGRCPQIEKATQFDSKGDPTSFGWFANENFNEKSVSCLRRIADSKNKEAIQHPVVRMLTSRKWAKFAKKWFCIKAALYVVFLTLLSFALIYGSTRDHPTQYNGRADQFRAFCEVFSIIFLMFHFVDEISEMIREGVVYFMSGENYIDLLGIILTLFVLPLRFAEVNSQWTFAAIGYIFSFLRLFKFSNVTRTTGLYTTTVVNIIRQDITRFMVFFSVIFIGFCGAMYMALKVNDMQDTYRNFAWLMLAGFRALVEQQALQEEYDTFGWLSILILLTYMGVVIVILLNVLIAQLSYTYSEAKKMAKLQYAADTMRIVTRLEYSRLSNWNLRKRKYKERVMISDEDLAREILEDTEERHPWETVKDRITAVREIMRKVVKNYHQKDPVENVDEKLTDLRKIMQNVIGNGKGKNPMEKIDQKLADLTSLVQEVLSKS